MRPSFCTEPPKAVPSVPLTIATASFGLPPGPFPPTPAVNVPTSGQNLMPMDEDGMTLHQRPVPKALATHEPQNANLNTKTVQLRTPTTRFPFLGLFYDKLRCHNCLLPSSLFAPFLITNLGLSRGKDYLRPTYLAKVRKIDTS